MNILFQLNTALKEPMADGKGAIENQVVPSNLKKTSELRKDFVTAGTNFLFYIVKEINMVDSKPPYCRDLKRSVNSAHLVPEFHNASQDIHVRLLLTMKINPYEGCRIRRGIFEVGTPYGEVL